MEKINLKEDRDFFIKEFRSFVNKNKKQLNESTGGYISDLLGELKLTFDKLKGTVLSDRDHLLAIRELNKFETKLKSILKGHGLIGW